MAPISLDDYRQNQPPGRRRPKSSTGAPNPEDTSSAPLTPEEADGDATLEPTGTFQAIRSAAARLTTSAEELLNHPPTPQPVAEPDPYMSTLLARRANEPADVEHTAAGLEPDATVDQAGSVGLGEHDTFFRELGERAPQPPSSGPTALGSASLHTVARATKKASRARVRAGRAGRVRPKRVDEPRPRYVPGVTAGAATVALILLIAGLAAANLGSSPAHPHAVVPAPSTALDAQASITMRTVRASILRLTSHHLPTPAKPRVRHRRRARPPVARIPAPTTASPAARSTSTYNSGASVNGPVSTGPVASSAGPASQSSASGGSAPAFGANGTLGPGRGAPGTQ